MSSNLSASTNLTDQLVDRNAMRVETVNKDAGGATGVAPFVNFLPSVMLLLACLAGFGLTFASELFSRIDAFRDQEISALRLVCCIGATLLTVQSVVATR